MTTPLNPKAKFDNLVIQELSDEILIYNLETNKAYSLNETSKLVWQNCDGKKDVSQIALVISKNLKQAVPDDLVWLALDSFKKEGLINFEGDVSSAFAGFNRREAVKRVGLASVVALPLIASIVAPTAINAQSGAGAPVCACVMKSDFDMNGCDPCGNTLGTCYGDSGCGVGMSPIEAINVTCAACHNLGSPGGNSWVPNAIP
jgi:hypothetical protein